MPHDIIVSAAAALNQQVRQYSADINQAFRVGLEFESFLPFVQCERTYSSVNASVGGLTQPYQAQFTPNNTETWDAVDNTLRPIKVDLQFTEAQLYELWDKWDAQRFEGGKYSEDWTYPKYILDQLVQPKLMEEMNDIAYNGVYAAPTLGTAGAVLDSANGYKKTIADAITAGSLTPIPSGAFTSSNIREKVEDWLKAFPIAARGIQGTILMSDTNARNYYYDFRSDFGTSTWTQLQNNGGLMVDGFSVKIKGIKAMEGSNRWIFVPDNSQNMIIGTRRGYPVYPQFIFDGSDLYSLKAKAVFYRFFGFEYWAKLYVNDQA